MHHPVAEGGSRDQARLGIVDAEIVVTAWTVSFLRQFALQTCQVLLQVKFEVSYFGAAALATCSALEGLAQVFKIDDLRIKVFMCLHNTPEQELGG